jgi:hypothetical protein
MIKKLNEHRSLCLEGVAIVSLEYACRHYNCFCEDCREQLSKAIDFDVKFIIMHKNHIIGVIL